MQSGARPRLRSADGVTRRVCLGALGLGLLWLVAAGSACSNNHEAPVGVEGSWSSYDLAFDHRPDEIEMIAAVDGGYLATGTDRAGFSVWWSIDMRNFEQVYLEECCDRHLRTVAIEQFGDRILVGAAGEDGPVMRSWLLVSDDRGVTWEEIDDPMFSTHNQQLHRLLVAGESVIAEIAINGPGNDTGPGFWHSADLDEWTPIELSGAQNDDWPSLVTDGSDVWAVAARRDPVPEPDELSTAAWRSTDGGRTFEPLAPAPVGVGHAAAVDGVLVVWPEPPRALYGEEEANAAFETGPWIHRTGAEEWERLPSDTGQWGDGGGGLEGEVDAGSGRLVGISHRARRSNPHYCFDDADTCMRYEAGLVTSVDGVEWFDMGGAELDGDRYINGVVLGDDGTVAVWQNGEAVSTGMPVHVRKWSGPGLPSLVDPVGPPPPEMPVPLYQGGPFPVGDEQRLGLGLGYCAGMYVDDLSWVPTEPLPDPVPDSWPHRSVQIADGPTGYVYGRITRVADDEIEFSIEGEGPVANFLPQGDAPSGGSCG